MKNYLIITVLICLMALPANAQERTKLAQAGMKFLSLSNDPRATAMGDAVTALEGNSSSMFFNPSAMSRQENLLSVSIGKSDWIAGINYMFGSLSVAPFGGSFGVAGVTVSSVDYGDFYGTKINGEGYVETGTYSPKAMTIGVGYAKALSDKFSVGGNIKYVYQSLGTFSVTQGQPTEKFEKSVAAFDFGLLYKTGYKSLNFGMDVRNFSQEVEYIRESFQLPLSFRIGFSMNVFDLTKLDPSMHSLLVVVDANKPRDYKEQISVGAEYTFYNTLSLRAGFTSPSDENNLNLGVGLKQSFMGYSLGIDYAYSSFGLFGDLNDSGMLGKGGIHRIGINMQL